MILIEYHFNSIYFKYEMCTKTIGFCLVSVVNNICKLENIEIKTSYRNKKYGSILIKFVINYLKCKKYYKIYGEVVPENKCKIISLINWYKKHKFKIKYTNTKTIILFTLNKFNINV